MYTIIDRIEFCVDFAGLKNMITDGANDFTECGPGAVLQGLIKKIDKEANAHGIA